MRIASSFFYRQASSEMARHQTELAKVQEQIASGKRILRPSDDPSAAALSLGVTEGIQRLKQFEENTGFAEQRLNLEDSTLDGVTSLLQRVKDLALAANSGVQTDETRTAYRTEVEQRLQDLYDYANSKDASGDYLFAGLKGDTRPFSRTGSNATYNGDQGQRFLQVGESRQIASGDSGYEVFQRVRNGNGTFTVGADSANTGGGVAAVGSVVDAGAYQAHEFTIQFTSDTTFDVIDDTAGATVLSGQTYTEGEAISFNGIETSIKGDPRGGDEFSIKPSRNQDIFTTLQNFVDAMGTSPGNGAQSAQLNQKMNGVIKDLDQSLGHVLEVRTSVGARLNALESAGQEIESTVYQLQQTLSENQDLDYVEAVGRLQFRMTTLEAVQGTFARLQGLSLFSLLR